MIYTFSYNIDNNDYLQFVKYHHGNSRDSRRRILFSQLVIPAVFAIWITMQLANSQNPAATMTMGIVFVIFSIVWIFFLSKHLLWLSMKSNLTAMQKNNTLPFDSKIRLELGDENICQITENSETKVIYSDIEKITQGPNAIYVYISATQAFIMPFSVFDSDIQRNEFLEFLRKKQTT